MKKKIDDNSGYTLVELIIVIAIIVILTTAAFITMSVMHTAKVKEAATTFDSEVTELVARCRNEQVYSDDNNNGVFDSGEEKPDYMYAIGFYEEDNALYLRKAFATGNLNSFTYNGALNTSNGGLGIKITSYAKVTYTDFDGSYDDVSVPNNHFIVFDKSGACVKNPGIYKFYKKNGGLIATVTINKNGSHQIK